MEMTVTFPGGLAVEAQMDQFTFRTDQPTDAGGEGSAPSPFQVFLSSIANCTGYFALAFCKERGISTEGMELTASFDRDPKTHKLTKAKIHLQLPPGFPEKYGKAILRTMDQCSVKRTIIDPPEFELAST